MIRNLRSDRSSLGHFASLESFDAHPDPFGATVLGHDFHFLNIRLELALVHFGNVGADTAAFLTLSLAVDDASCGGSFTRDLTYSGHDEIR
jgi:hypothetical protein